MSISAPQPPATPTMSCHWPCGLVAVFIFQSGFFRGQSGFERLHLYQARAQDAPQEMEGM